MNIIGEFTEGIDQRDAREARELTALKVLEGGPVQKPQVDERALPALKSNALRTVAALEQLPLGGPLDEPATMACVAIGTAAGVQAAAVAAGSLASATASAASTALAIEAAIATGLSAVASGGLGAAVGSAAGSLASMFGFKDEDLKAAGACLAENRSAVVVLVTADEVPEVAEFLDVIDVGEGL